jgi:hypothetical protein
MYKFDVTALLLITLVAGALALAFDYFPGLAKWFDAKPAETKRLINAGGVIGFALIIFVGQCFAIFLTNLVCSVKGGMDLLYIIFLALATNQGVHLALKPTQRFKERMFGFSRK